MYTDTNLIYRGHTFITKKPPEGFDAKPNIFTPQSILRPEYGVLYDHIGQLYQGLQGYYLVIGIPLPKEKDVPDAYTDLKVNCQYRSMKGLVPLLSENTQAMKDLNQICVNFVNVIEKRSKVLKKMKQQLKHKIHSDMPALLPNPIIDFHTQTPGLTHISPYAKLDEVIQLGEHNITKRSFECYSRNSVWSSKRGLINWKYRMRS